VELVVIKGGSGKLCDGSVELQGKGQNSFQGIAAANDRPEVGLGKRYQSPDGSVVILITKAGRCDLRYDGKPMQVQTKRELPSSD
jgi:hypothetical protein